MTFRTCKISGPFNPNAATAALKAAGFKFISEACPVKLAGQWLCRSRANGSSRWYQWDDASPRALTAAERDLLQWLVAEDVSQYGECFGPTLNALISLRLVHFRGDGNFIPKEIGFCGVELTEKGKALLLC